MSKYFSISGNYHTDKRKTSLSFNALLYNKLLFEAVPKCQKRVAIIQENTRWVQSAQNTIFG
jgi:hypothetical protein